jgi:hypothetical protein
MQVVSCDVIERSSQTHVISSEHPTCTRSDPSVRVMPGGEACVGFVTVTVSELALGSVADQRLSALS